VSHYTVGYHTLQQEKREICEYAEDSFQAFHNAQEDVPYLKEHPHFFDYILKED